MLRKMDIHLYCTVASTTAVIGGKAAITCNVSVPMDESVILILWYKGDTTGAPIYSVDLRYTDSLTAEHFQSKTLLNRAVFDVNVKPFSLFIDPVKEEDDGLYFCRIDFRWSPTISVPIMLQVIGELLVKKNFTFSFFHLFLNKLEGTLKNVKYIGNRE
ncbi:nephrin-like protein [Leptotrombidium deliense]|uniref:Nephrin-like protein n=1 Tax=Leptotrombidium deliense TaxID=299467 RepID=A0A443S945_9ACAR|nr:nephrin-like protein [Leptotrombidium deliense]